MAKKIPHPFARFHLSSFILGLAGGIFLMFFYQLVLYQSIPVSSNVPAAVPTPTPTMATGNIQVRFPTPGATVSLPFTITGQARVFENQFNYRIKDANGTLLQQGTAYANSQDAGQFGPFTITISSLPHRQGNTGTIEVFDYSARDGSEIDKVVIPVIFN